MHCVLVSHTHWDREWYRTFESFRARLVDTVDRVLDLLAADPGYHFVLDGQSIVLEDYLAIRPERRPELAAAVAARRLAIGPWYVQPDSLLPSGEAHLRNLLEGRRVGAEIGPVSTVAYTPDSFGHPAQFPQLFRGFGLDGFIYWRGNAQEIDTLPAQYRWVAPDGTRMLACHLSSGYFAAAGFGEDIPAVVEHLRKLGERLAQRSPGDCVLFMNGSDHAPPDAQTGAVAEALAKATGWVVERALLDAFVEAVPRDLPEFEGELLGGRMANLLPGVWSARTPLKLCNRRCETLLERWAEPWAALGRALGAPDERPGLRRAWRSLLANQAHDSICGCSQDRVHEQMRYRYDAAEELAHETTTRMLERVAGLAADRCTPWTDEPELAVFNPSPHPRTDVVRFPLDPWPGFVPRSDGGPAIHPLLLANLGKGGFRAEGEPVRLVGAAGPWALQIVEDRPTYELEFIARDLPAFGWRRVKLERCETPAPDEVDSERSIAAGEVEVRADHDGTLRVRLGEVSFEGLGRLEDVGDRGDSYDFDPVPAGDWSEGEATVQRRRHPSGIQELEVLRTLRVPAALAPDRTRRSDETVSLPVVMEARVLPGVCRVDLRVRVENHARDHRLRIVFPTGAPAEGFAAATTFDVAARRTAPPDATSWRHPAPRTFPHQGWIAANGLMVVAPGLPEAEVTPQGEIAVTLVRAVGWLSRGDLSSRPDYAGPPLPTPGAQCLETIEARLALLPGLDPRAARDAELGLRAVTTGPNVLAHPDTPLLEVEPRELLLSALKPAQDGEGMVLRLLNPTDRVLDARVRVGFEVTDVAPVRLDEKDGDDELSFWDGELQITVPARSLRSVRLR